MEQYTKFPYLQLKFTLPFFNLSFQNQILNHSESSNFHFFKQKLRLEGDQLLNKLYHKLHSIPYHWHASVNIVKVQFTRPREYNSI
jgi:hypothetical protein